MTEKLRQETVDFEKLDGEKWKEGNWDVVFITCVVRVFYLKAFVRGWLVLGRMSGDRGWRVGGERNRMFTCVLLVQAGDVEEEGWFG